MPFEIIPLDLSQHLSHSLYLNMLSSRSNFVGTEFVVFDKGVNPKDAGSAAASAVSSTSVRQELASVIYVRVSILQPLWMLSRAFELDG